MTKSRWFDLRADAVIRALITVALFGSTFYLGLQKQPAEMGIMAAMGLVLLAFTNLDRFTSFKGAGFEAQMREIKAVTEEAEASLAQLQKMSTVTSEIITAVVAGSGRFDVGFTPEQALDFRIRVTDALIAMDIPKDQAEKITSPMTRYGTYDFVNDIQQSIESKEGLHNFEGESFWRRFIQTYPNFSPQQLKEALREKNIEHEETVLLLDRMEKWQEEMNKKYGSYPSRQISD